MSGAEFKELVRRTFHLKLSGTEVGALFDFFNNGEGQEVIISPFNAFSLWFILVTFEL
jgi:hypothetical protein